MSLPPLLLGDLAAAIERSAGVSLDGALGVRLPDGVEAAARQAGEAPRAFARRVLGGDAAALAALVEQVVVCETAFWRHPDQLAAVGRLARAARGPLAVWSAGCSTGEEPYSVAIALLEAGRAGRGDRILATDLSARALATARAATYGARAFRLLPPELAGRWFEGAAERRVAAAARALVVFEQHNLAADPAPPGPFDLVLCRNVVIYFGLATATGVLRRLAGALRPGGVLLLGPVELPLASGLGLDPVPDGATTLLVRPQA